MRMYLSATNMPARKHLTATRVNSLSVGREASALQAEANIVTDADFVTQSELFDMRGWRMLNTRMGQRYFACTMQRATSGSSWHG
jgi:hypothetical protein